MTYKKIILLVFVLLAGTVVFAGSTLASESVIDEMDGDGTENNPYAITNVEELQAMDEDLEAHYILENDIDASETAAWNGGAGFEPIGDQKVTYTAEEPFTGSLDGQGHTIEGLTIDRPDDGYVALFDSLHGSVESVSLEDADISGDRAATLAGYLEGDVSSVYASGDVEGERDAGGLVASNGRDSGATLDQSGSTVEVTGGGGSTGGLIGYGGGIQITTSYATGDVEGTDGDTGNIAGRLLRFSDIRNSYATGDIEGEDVLGGLVGHNSGSIVNSYSTGEISGGESVDGIAWTDRGSVNAGYWNVQVSSYTDGEGTSLRSADMTGGSAETNMNEFDFDNFWTLTDDYPVLEWQVQDVSITLDDSTVGEGQQTDVTVTLTLDDGSTVTASKVADYDAGGIVDVDSGVVDANQQGTTEITATVADQSDSAELEVVEPPNIELEESDLDANAVVEGSPLTATATYENDGGPGSHTAELTADGEVVDTQTVSLEADDETEVDFEWTPDGPVGTEYDVSVDGTDLGSVAVVESGTVSLADFSVPEEVGSGAPYEFTVDLENAGDETVVDTVAYELEGQTVITEPVAVDPDGSIATLSYETDVDSGLTVVHGVTVDDESLEETSQVTEPPSFDVTDLETPEDVEPGDEFDVSVTVENTGGVEGTQSVTVSDNDSEVATEELTLEADSSETVSLPVSEDAAGEYEYTVATDDDETAATVTVSEEAGDDGAGDSDGSDGLPGFGAAVAAGALAVVMTVAALRRRN